jgi:hypothetical protein
VGSLLVLTFTSTSPSIFATDTGWQQWNNPKPIGVGQFDQSPDLVTNTPQGTLSVSYMDVYMSVIKVLPGDATFIIAAMYGPTEQWFDAGEVYSSSSTLQGIRIVLSPAAKCGLSGGDFRFTVLFEQRDISFEPQSWQCITKIFHDQATFPSTGTLHVKLAYYFESSMNNAQTIMLNPSKPSPKVNTVFSVTAPQSTVTVSQTVSPTPATTQTSETTSSPSALVQGQSMEQVLPYAAIAGGILVAALSLYVLKVRKGMPPKEETKIWDAADTTPCLNCGKPLALGTRFCEKCGAEQTG